MNPNHDHFHSRCFASITFSIALLAAAPAFAASDGDDFNDNSKNSSKWGADKIIHHGKLTEANGHLEYTVTGATTEDDAWRPWILTRFPYNADWELQFDTFNSSVPSIAGLVDSIGILIQPTTPGGSGDNELFAELYSSAEGGLPSRTGFHAEISDSGFTVGTLDSEGGNGVTNGAIRITFTSSNKVFAIYYDTDVSNGYQWVRQGTFGVLGGGGTNGNAFWGDPSDTIQFAISIYGFSAGMNIVSGQMFVDNFLETGGVAPNGGTVPDPTGGFDFTFPTNNALLTKIVSLAGNYHGVSPTHFQRNYDFDVAEDESGKLAVMGTIDGITNKDGSAEVSGGSGAITSVNGKPTAQLRGSFNGTRDGVATTFTGKGAVPAEIVDVPGGPGISGTGTYASKVGGVPFSGKNVPVQVAAPPGATDNLQQNWSFHLDIHKKLVGTAQRTAASAQLVLPNGDAISFPDKLIKYSANKGYMISFARGTNTTIQPNKIDTRSTIAIKNLTFVQQGSDWQPTGGTLSYKFLGQKGTANLLDLMGP